MVPIKKKIIIIFLLLIACANSYSQSSGTLVTYTKVSDSLKNKLQNPLTLEAYRQYFWKNIPKPIGWVSDFDDIFTKKNLDVLDSTLKQFNMETGIQMAIVTLDTFCISKDNFDDLALHIANYWGVGRKDKDNGILISICKGYRLMKINNGYGIEKFISDEETKAIIDKYFIPYFKNGDYYQGTLTGLTEYINLIKRKRKKD